MLVHADCIGAMQGRNDVGVFMKNLHRQQDDKKHRDEDDQVHPPPLLEMRTHARAEAALGRWQGSGSLHLSHSCL